MNLRFYVYILISIRDHKFYIGYTHDLKQRLRQHARGEVSSTFKRRPLKLILYEYFVNEKDARAREQFLKSGYGHSQLAQILKNTNNNEP